MIARGARSQRALNDAFRIAAELNSAYRSALSPLRPRPSRRCDAGRMLTLVWTRGRGSPLGPPGKPAAMSAVRLPQGTARLYGAGYARSRTYAAFPLVYILNAPIILIQFRNWKASCLKGR